LFSLSKNTKKPANANTTALVSTGMAGLIASNMPPAIGAIIPPLSADRVKLHKKASKIRERTFGKAQELCRRPFLGLTIKNKSNQFEHSTAVNTSRLLFVTNISGVQL
jgi:hypothetical protein